MIENIKMTLDNGREVEGCFGPRVFGEFMSALAEKTTTELKQVLREFRERDKDELILALHSAARGFEPPPATRFLPATTGKPAATALDTPALREVRIVEEYQRMSAGPERMKFREKHNDVLQRWEKFQMEDRKEEKKLPAPLARIAKEYEALPAGKARAEFRKKHQAELEQIYGPGGGGAAPTSKRKRRFGFF